MITINGLSLPTPHALSIEVMPRGGSSQYNALGQLVQEGMLDKRIVEITWRRMAGNMLALLAGVLHQGGILRLSYPDPLSGTREMECFLKRHSARVWQYCNGVPGWADVQLTLEEQ